MERHLDIACAAARTAGKRLLDLRGHVEIRQKQSSHNLVTQADIDHLFSLKIRGIRRMGCAAIDLCWVACGRFDAFFEYRLAPWDYAAGSLIVQEAGGKCADRAGDSLRLSSESVLSSNPNVFDRFVEAVRWNG